MLGAQATSGGSDAELAGLRAELAGAQDAAQAAEQEAARLRGRLAAAQEELRVAAARAAAQVCILQFDGLYSSQKPQSSH